MPKNRIKQRKNLKSRRYEDMLCREEDKNKGFKAAERIYKTDSNGIKDLTAYNALHLLEDEDWQIVYR